MKVRYRDKEWEVQGPRLVRDLITEVNLRPNSVLAMRDGRLIDVDTMVEDDEEIRFVAVISGG